MLFERKTLIELFSEPVPMQINSYADSYPYNCNCFRIILYEQACSWKVYGTGKIVLWKNIIHSNKPKT